jgi:hypothetical protein
MKRLLVLFVLLFTVFFTYTTIAQEMGVLKKGISINFPEKIHKLVLDPLPAGTYSVGAGGYFATIQSAFDKLSIDGIAGAVTLELIDNLYTAPTDSLGFFLNGPIPGAGANSRVTIKPAVNKNVIIEGNRLTVLYFLNTNYVTLDGINLTGATTLTIHTLYNAAYIYNDGIDFMDNSDHNVMQNIIFINEDETRASGSGFWTVQNNSTAPDSNLIQNNFVKQAGMALYVVSQNALVRAKGNIIRGNKIGSETDSLITWGIQVEKSQNTIVENNIVQNIKATWSLAGIGIHSYYGSGDIIRNNVIHNIKSSAGASTGILLGGDNGEVGSNNQVYNNMVYNIQSTSTQYDSRVTGIQMWQQNNPKIYYNSVYLSGNGANPYGSAALYIWSNCTNVEVKNNILVNTRNESPYIACSINLGVNPLTDYNDLYYEPNQYNCLVRLLNTKFNDLAQWQATGKDLHSISEMPNFASPDLHLNWNYTTLLDGHATPITGITTDFDGEPRNALTPDIGADEGVVLPVELTSFTATTSNNEVILNWSTATELNNYGFEIQRKILGNEFATVAFLKGQGTTTQQNQYSFADKNLDEGKYFYRLKQMDYGGQFSYSQVVEVDVRSVDHYTLEQNYPNPFNPTTTIGYVLQEKGNTKLTLLNSLGEEIAVLVNEEQDKGYHKVEFDGSRLASGVYLYKIQSGSFVETKKVILLR